VAIGGHAETLHQLARSRAHADEVLRVLREPGNDTTCAAIEDVRGRVQLLRFLDHAADESLDPSGPIEVLLRHDADTGSQYARTLAAHFDAFGDAALAGRLLHVHPATYRYRMRRIRELTSARLDDPQERLALMLQVAQLRHRGELG
jgi:sugar diacid utilization regulator